MSERADSPPGAAYPRDMVGYGAVPPKADWPGGARLALQFVVNYEEGGEASILHGDQASEAFLSEIVGADARAGVRHMNMESLYEYGSRAGFWRLYRLFTRRQMPVTVFAVAMALERNPEVVAALKDSDWEVASHGWRWIDYQYTPAGLEWEHMVRAIEIQERLMGTRPRGWYTGRSSPMTRELVAREGGFTYCADTYADDLPYWEQTAAGPLLLVPYTLDINDMRFATAQGFNSGDQFHQYMKDSFDVLYEEGREYPRMMSVGLHCRLAGRPGRAAALARFLDYVRSFDDVWVTTRLDIARHWQSRHPPPGPEPAAGLGPKR